MLYAAVLTRAIIFRHHRPRLRKSYVGPVRLFAGIHRVAGTSFAFDVIENIIPVLSIHLSDICLRHAPRPSRRR